MATKIIILFLVLGLTSFSFTSPVGAGITDDKWIEIIKPEAEQGDAEAQHNLGVIYDTGVGVPQDYKKAVIWYTKAAKQGIAVSQYNLALMYENGDGVKQDHAQALYWYIKAAEQGKLEAQYNLGFKYYLGTGVQKDMVTAFAWFNTASSRGDKNAIKLRDDILKDLTPEQITKAQELFKQLDKKININK